MNFSNYSNSLLGEVATRYFEKLEMCDGVDPYTIPSVNSWRDLKLLPKVTYLDLVNYLVFKTSYSAGESLRSYKALDSFILFEN